MRDWKIARAWLTARIAGGAVMMSENAHLVSATLSALLSAPLFAGLPGFTSSTDFPAVNPFQATLPSADFQTKAAFSYLLHQR